MSLGQIVIFAGDHANPFPEILAALVLATIVLLEADGDIIGFTDVNPRVD